MPRARFRAAVTTSPITADAVGAPPAPCPRNISCPASRESTKMALKAPDTDASGCFSPIIVGWTFTTIRLSLVVLAIASSLTVQFIASAAAMSSVVSAVMPSQNTSSRVTSVWKASVARMAALAAASWPSTSAVGSASA